MKKTGIITHYDVHNHGAHLQLYALAQTLKELGYDAKALQYQKNYDFMGGIQAGNKYNISLKSIPIYIRYVLKNGIFRTVYNIKKRKILSEFRAQKKLVGGFYSEASDLDAVVIGSDEIFSIEAGPNPWYFGIGIPCKKQISYAASFGPTSLNMIDDHNMNEFVKAGLSNIKYISVRDANSALIVEHYLGKKTEIVCDPVLLYDFSKKLSDKVLKKFRKKHPEKYCIVYSYDYNMNDSNTIKSIKHFAKKRGLKVYSIGYYHGWCDKSINLDPLEVLKWFACSEFVFTDTFHGSVISLATGTQFVAMIRGNSNKLKFLLEQYNVSNRIINRFDEIEKVVKNNIDYTQINIVIRDLREKSRLYLSESLKKVNEEEFFDG